MKLHKTLVSVFCLFIMASSVLAETTQCTAITSVPATIDQPGVYCLQQNLSGGKS